MVEPPHYLVEEDLSRAWARVFLAVMEPGVDEISPLCVTVRGLDEGRPVEEPAIRQALDEALAAHGKLPVHTVANTIFPRSRWDPELGRERLFERYAKMLPMIKKADPRNRNGTYFERMMSFGPDKINQLEHIISTYARGNRRRSALQAVVFDPAKDHTDQPQRGFPCLQYVSFAPIGKTKLRVTGVYATQYLFEKAYGNYLGLYELGRFMAHELGLELTQLSCIASVAKRGDLSKKSLRGLAAELEALLSESGEDAETGGAVA
jgi:hypothetical protein